VLPWRILEASTRFRVPEAVTFLVDVFLNDSFGEGARDSALGAVQDLVYGRSDGDDTPPSVHDTPEKKAIVLKALGKLMTAAEARDRWDGADMLIHVGGGETIDTIMAGLTGDLRTYARYTRSNELEMPDYIIIEMCGDKLKEDVETVRPKLEVWVKKGDHVQKAFSMLCLKAMGAKESADTIKTQFEDTTTLEYLFFTTEEYAKRKPLLADNRIPMLTVGLLAQNVVDGFAMLDSIEKERAAGTVSDDDARLKVVSAIAVISFTGDTYKLAVEKSFARKKARANGKEAPDDGADSLPPEDPAGTPEGSDPTDKKPTDKKPTDKKPTDKGKGAK